MFANDMLNSRVEREYKILISVSCRFFSKAKTQMI